MEEFVLDLENNMQKTSQDRVKKTTSRIRTLFSYIISSNSDIKITERCTKDGDITFEVPTKEMGLPYPVLKDYKTEIYSDFVANSIGELLVRENINEFAKIIMELNVDDYPLIVDKYEHRRFGMEIVRDKFVFRFHISLLNNILTENFKRKIR